MKKIGLLFSLFCISYFSNAQITGDCNSPYDQAAAMVSLLVGDGVEFSNASFSGFDCSAGFFDGSNSNIGIESGLVMSPGSVPSIVPGSVGAGNGGLGFEADLTTQFGLVGGGNPNLNNVLVLEFDFIPNSALLSFEYVFASNEYPSFTCSNYNDIFGFFISGPGINGPFLNNAENIALIPDPNNPGSYTNTPVTINTLNSGVSSTGNTGPCDDIDPNWQDYSVFYTDNSDLGTVNFPGFTVPLTAQLEVVPCESYHFKLAIADVFDGSLNSAVFIEEGSFSAAPPSDWESEIIYNLEDLDFIVEGCGTTSFTIYKPENYPGEFSVEYHLYGDATYGVDYTLTGTNGYDIVIPAGEQSVTITIDALYDWNFEGPGTESIFIEVDEIVLGCGVIASQIIEIQIADQPPLALQLETDAEVHCHGDPLEINTIVSGGTGPFIDGDVAYTYEWSHIATNADVVVYPSESQEYCVQVSDFCEDQIAVACVDVFVPIYEEVEAESEIIYLCEDVEAELCVDVEGGDGDYTYQWSNGGQTQCIFDFYDEYTVQVLDGCFEGLEVNGAIRLDIAPEPIFEMLDIIDVNLGVEFNNYTYVSPSHTYLWNFDDGTGSTVVNPLHTFDVWGDYNVTLTVTTDIAGCIKESTQTILVRPLFYFYAPSAFSPNGDSKNDKFLPLVTGAKTYELFIYNRWGEQVFYTNDDKEAWDGKMSNGKLAPQDVYIYKALLTKEWEPGIIEETGRITLIR